MKHAWEGSAGEEKLAPGVERYRDMLDLPHHVSPKRTQMSLYDRAAQFSPFAALTGYDGKIRETARLTDSRVMLDENMTELLDQRLQLILEHVEEQPKIEVTCFQQDRYKDGGSYQRLEKQIKSIDTIQGNLEFTDRTVIPIQDILEIDGELIREAERQAFSNLPEFPGDA